METLRSIGFGIGEYVRDGQGESEATTPAPMSIDADLGVTDPDTTFSSLIKTSKRIPAVGKKMTYFADIFYECMF